MESWKETEYPKSTYFYQEIQAVRFAFCWRYISNATERPHPKFSNLKLEEISVHSVTWTQCLNDISGLCGGSWKSENKHSQRSLCGIGLVYWSWYSTKKEITFQDLWSIDWQRYPIKAFFWFRFSERRTRETKYLYILLVHPHRIIGCLFVENIQRPTYVPARPAAFPETAAAIVIDSKWGETKLIAVVFTFL